MMKKLTLIPVLVFTFSVASYAEDCASDGKAVNCSTSDLHEIMTTYDNNGYQKDSRYRAAKEELGRRENTRKVYTFGDGARRDFVNGLGTLVGTGAVTTAKLGLVQKATQQVLFNASVHPTVLNEEEIQSVMAGVRSSPGRNTGIGSLGGGTIEIMVDRAALNRALASRNLQHMNVSDMVEKSQALSGGPLRDGGLVSDVRVGSTPKPEAVTRAANALNGFKPDYQPLKINLRTMTNAELQSQLALLKESGVTVGSIRYVSLGGKLAAGALDWFAVAGSLSGVAKLAHSGILALKSPTDYEKRAAGASDDMAKNLTRKPGVLSHIYSDANSEAWQSGYEGKQIGSGGADTPLAPTPEQ